MRTSLPLVLASALALPAAASAQYDIIAYESFDYGANSLMGNLNGGSGWAAPWTAGPIDDWGIVTSPGFDGVGFKGQVQWEHLEVGRLIDTTPWSAITEDVGGVQMFGVDGTELWLSVRMQRSQNTAFSQAPSLSNYGGISFRRSNTLAEELFLGSPGGTLEYGIQRPGPWTTLFIGGSLCDDLRHLVLRIQFMPGADQVDVWMDPTTNHPTGTPPNVTGMFQDLKFDEVIMRAGTGWPNGFDFDDIEISTPATSGPLLTVFNLVAGGSTTLTVDNATPGGLVGFAYSLTGGGPSTANAGGCGAVTVELSAPIQVLPQVTANAAGQANLASQVPAGAAGLTVWIQALDISSCTLTNGLMEVIS